MALSTRVIKRRIKSVENTKKITKAMELVSAAKMRRAVLAVLGSRPYATLSWEVIEELAKVTSNEAHPMLTAPREVNNVLVFVVASDRGLCGAFNAQLVKQAATYIRTLTQTKVAVQAVTVGKRAESVARAFGWNLVAAFPGMAERPSIADIQPLAQIASDAFVNKTVDRVVFLYTDFVSSLHQEPRAKQLLPLGPELALGAAAVRGVAAPPEFHVGAEVSSYTFEPSPQAVLEHMLPRIMEARLYQAILESAASEHAARMLAMQSASKSAQDFIDDLVFTFNQARQASITREIAEISSGKVTLEYV